MRDRRWVLVIVAVAIAASFGAGFAAASANAKGYRIYVADCYATAKGVSCAVGDTTYGASDVVAWTDAQGVGRGGVNDPSEWPACLPPLTQTKGVRFAGAMLPIGDNAFSATVVWVDCRGR